MGRSDGLVFSVHTNFYLIMLTLKTLWLLHQPRYKRQRIIDKKRPVIAHLKNIPRAIVMNKYESSLAMLK